MRNHLKPTVGDRLRVLQDVCGYVHEPLPPDAGRIGMGKTPRTLRAGERVVFLGQDYGPGIEAVFEATLRTEDGREVSLPVAFRSLGADHFARDY